MCGIAGYVGKGDRLLLERMCQSMLHRGPDEDGYFVAPGIGLGMRRLSIIDLAGGRQPIGNEDGSVIVVFNGEIYNYQELTAVLKDRGHVFRTNSDTETIVHLYEDHGLDFVEHLRGMFAIALWDTRLRRLVLVRDRIGEKPLFFRHAEDDGSLLFGSEIKAILQHGDARRVHAQALCQFMAAGYLPAPNTFYQGIQKVPPACMLVHENHKVEIRRYWNREPGSRKVISFDDACAELSGLLVDSVRLCLKSDVEVGSFLSGGLDSSVITGIMRQLGAEVRTFSVGYRGAAAGFNEFSHARRVADHLGTKHHELVLRPDSTIDLLPRILWHFDEPNGEPTSVLVFLLSEFTRRQVKVAMGGTGGDEIFYGYPKHAGLRMLEYYRLLPRFVREGLLERVIGKWPESTMGSRFAKRAKRFVAGAGLPPEDAYLSWTSLLNRDLRNGLLSSRVMDDSADPSGDVFLRDYLAASGRGSLLDRVTDMEIGGYLPEYQLTYMDRMSMAAGLEARSPLCDWMLVDYVTSLPGGYRLKGTRSKHIFKAIATQWIPKEIAERKKVGFDSPIGQWIKDELREFMSSFLSPEHISKTGLFEPDAVRQLLAAHLAGRNDYSMQLWSILSVEAWHRMFIEDGISGISGYSLRDIRGAGGLDGKHIGPGTLPDHHHDAMPAADQPEPITIRNTPSIPVNGHAARRSVCLSVDYEIFGNGSGDVRRHVTEPTERMARACEKIGVPLTVFLEVEEYLAFGREREKLLKAWGYDPAAEIRAQALELIGRGHDLQLHLHPEWLGAGFADGHWHLRPEMRTVDGLFETQDEVSDYIRQRKAVIDGLYASAGSPRRVTAYRCGAFRAQPGGKLLRALADNGILIDSSLVKGMVLQDGHGRLDFTGAPASRRHWRVSGDVADEDTAGPVTEIPIYSRMGRRVQQLTPRRLMAKFSGNIPKENQRELVSQLGMGRTPASVLGFLARRFPIKLDFHNMSAAQMLRWLRQAPPAPPGDLDVIVTIGHSKEHRNDAEFAKFLAGLATDPRLEVVSMTDLANRLIPTPVPASSGAIP